MAPGEGVLVGREIVGRFCETPRRLTQTPYNAGFAISR